MRHFYRNVPELGNVAVSHHAQSRCHELHISEDTFCAVLHEGTIIPEGDAITWREARGVRLIILNRPEPFRGAKLVKTVIRVQSNARAP